MWETIIQVGGWGFLLPAFVSWGLLELSRKVLSESTWSRHAPGLAMLGGVTAGYAFLPSAAWVPERHWHWIPILCLAAWIVGAVGRAAGVSVFERCLLTGCLMVSAACFLVPTWSSLSPGRTTWIGIVALYGTLLACLLEPLTTRIHRSIFWLSLCASALAVSGCIAFAISLTYGRLALLAAGVIGGVTVFSLFSKSTVPLVGVGCSYAILVGGCGFVGLIEPQPPQWALAIGPAASCLLWIAVLFPQESRTRLPLLVVQCLMIAAALATMVGWVVFGGL